MVAEAEPDVLSSQDMASALGWDLSIQFNNDEDDESTVVTVQGQDQTDLLMSLTGAFNSLNLIVHSARIDSQPGGEFRDVFHISTKANEKIPKTSWAEVKGRLYAMVSESSRSSKPAIYGAPSSQEPPRLQPVRRENDTRDLEKAAGEMAQAASRLVEIERNIVSLTEDGAGQQELTVKESERAEAASLLERRMAAMEAILAARRAVQQEPSAQTETEAAREGGGEMRFQQGGASSTGPAAGDGFEIILQGFNWESCKGVNGKPFWQVLQSQAHTIAEAGFTSVWLPPPSDAVSDQGYLPRDLYNLDSKYGSQAELRNCISVLHENNLKAIADIVINHRCANSQEDGKWNKFGGRLPWDKSYICKDNPDYGGTGNHKTGEDYHAAPTLTIPRSG
ncbi:hypothetical protein WJX84_004190 [Apatococcus fuscideae]|uniref:1,4-alpha-D-glucan glucanohydrolase n=1 Tax=Apatococcus fuscideae TaxID=2026836 RepID=A0AAW1SLB1_9CHLO